MHVVLLTQYFILNIALDYAHCLLIASLCFSYALLIFHILCIVCVYVRTMYSLEKFNLINHNIQLEISRTAHAFIAPTESTKF